MPYSSLMVNPMKAELSSVGFEELLSADDVDRFMNQESDSSMVVVNSVCGCAAGQARPGVRIAIESELRPQRLATVFAGQDVEATARMRSHISDIPPSSPSIALFKGKELVYFVPRHRIESRSAQEVADDLIGAFSRFLAPEKVA